MLYNSPWSRDRRDSIVSFSDLSGSKKSYPPLLDQKVVSLYNSQMYHIKKYSIALELQIFSIYCKTNFHYDAIHILIIQIKY